MYTPTITLQAFRAQKCIAAVPERGSPLAIAPSWSEYSLDDCHACGFAQVASSALAAPSESLVHVFQRWEPVLTGLGSQRQI
jgi:hypothetical protein